MARLKRADPKTKGKQRPKLIIRRQRYTSELKSKATTWKLVSGMKMTAIQNKVKDHYGIKVALPTLYGWVSKRKKIFKKWLVKSTRKTEYHQSSTARGNDPTVPHLCKLCPRRFKSNVNLTLHVYWHTINDQEVIDNSDDAPADPMEVIESQDDELYRFTITIAITMTFFCYISWMASNINH